MESQGFPLFGRLPLELRELIWQAAFTDLSEPQVQYVGFSVYFDFDGVALDDDLDGEEDSSGDDLQAVMSIQVMNLTPPTTNIVRACREAAATYTRFRKLNFPLVRFRAFDDDMAIRIGPSTVLSFDRSLTANLFAKQLGSEPSAKVRGMAVGTGLPPDLIESGLPLALAAFPGLRDVYLSDLMPMAGWRVCCPMGRSGDGMGGFRCKLARVVYQRLYWPEGYHFVRMSPDEDLE